MRIAAACLAGHCANFHELLGIEEFEGSLRLVVKHFHPDWVGWEEKDVAQKFRLTRLTADEMAFGSLVFQRTAPDAFVFRLMKDGTSKVESINFRKQPL